ncbi:hypothetical protein HNQ68_002292 [Pseudochrobactrum saccharolyticum]|uniref:ABC transporter permease n=1 Tax=Pseudochrobactrum saccharolyticum TaxID=354352 RepID=A0A7W8AM21_9HYPH|nr:hypothetical protein [Pseudochrobactrum saccharolyticum]
MSIQRYRLTASGWIGAALFILPTPIAVWLSTPPNLSEGEAAFQRRLTEMSGAIQIHTPSPLLLTILATLTLIGLVMVIVGREIHTD